MHKRAAFHIQFVSKSGGGRSSGAVMSFLSGVSPFFFSSPAPPSVVFVALLEAVLSGFPPDASLSWVVLFDVLVSGPLSVSSFCGSLRVLSASMLSGGGSGMSSLQEKIENCRSGSRSRRVEIVQVVCECECVRV